MLVANPKSWDAIAAEKRASVAASIPTEWLIPSNLMPAVDQLDVTTFPTASGFFSESELTMTSATALEIIEKIATKEWTSELVTLAFCKRAAVAHQLTNCLAETLFTEAVTQAKELDAHLAKTGKVTGPLHGLPISLKDNFNIIGKDSTLGFVAYVNDPATYNSVLVDILKSQGAVVYVKTTVPTAMMIAETVSNTTERTTNPLNRNLSPGGSSGGESALIAFGGSVLGVGSDIGGSLRIPASACGLFTIRPSAGRFPTAGAKPGLAGQEAVNSVNGPMGKSLADIVHYSKVVVDSEPWKYDPKCVPIPWRTVERKQKLKIGVLWNDGEVTPTPPVRRAMKLAVEKLVKAGHEVVDWNPETSHIVAAKLLAQMFVADGGKSIKGLLNKVSEPWRPEMKAYEEAVELGAHELWQVHIKRNDLAKAYLDRWRASGVDAILSPATPYSTVPHGSYKHVGYTAIWNIIDYSAVVFPSGTVVDKDIDRKTPAECPFGPQDEQVQNEYDPELVHGMPVGLQLIGQRLEEEKILGITETVLEALKF